MVAVSERQGVTIGPGTLRELYGHIPDHAAMLAALFDRRLVLWDGDRVTIVFAQPKQADAFAAMINPLPKGKTDE